MFVIKKDLCNYIHFFGVILKFIAVPSVTDVEYGSWTFPGSAFRRHRWGEFNTELKWPSIASRDHQGTSWRTT